MSFSPLSLFGITKNKHLETGAKVPDFSLQDQDGNTFNIKDHIGKNILVIYFYPTDEGAVCTREACSFRDNFESFTDAGAMVIGINSGSVESHKAFAEHHKLPFTLLSDKGDEVLHKFGVKGQLIFSGRETFVIDLDGRVGFSFKGLLEGDAHVKKALEFIKAHAKK